MKLPINMAKINAEQVRLLATALFALCFFANACDSDIGSESETVTNGRVMISSESFGEGFSFSEGSVTTNNPDVLVSVQVSDFNEVEGVFLRSETDSGFRFISNLDTESEAEEFFSNLTSVPTSGYDPLALFVEKNQIWAVHDNQENFAKLRIISTSVSPDRVGTVEFEWVYQTNGDTQF